MKPEKSTPENPGGRTAPQWITRFIEWICAPQLREEVLGDLHERYALHLQQWGEAKARRRYWREVLAYVRPSVMKRRPAACPSLFFLQPDMLRNYLKIAWRNLLQDRLFTCLNLLGLSMGLGCIVLIYLWVNDELTIDQFHANGHRLYQVMRNLEEGPNDIHTYENNSDLLVPALASEMPEIEYVVPTSDGLSDGILSIGDKNVKAVGKYAGVDFFTVFSYPLRQGNKNQVLRDKNSVVISDELAVTLFGSTDKAINKIIHWNEEPYTGNYTITGVFEKPQSNSSETFDLLLTNALYLAKNRMDKSWDSNRVIVYVVLKEGVDADKFNAKIKDFVRNKFVTANGTKNLHWIGTLFLQRYSEKYLHNVYGNGVPTGGRIEYIKLFAGIALCVLIIACINFMNLSTAKASKRMKEVGVKKVMGASRSTLVIQYLSESILLSFLALCIALIFVVLVLPVFNDITSKKLSLQAEPRLVLTLLMISTVTGLLAGSYPAFYLSGFKPVIVLKGKFQTSFSQLWIRKGLVVFQFALSVLFMVGVLVIYRQMEFVQTKNLGYNKENIIHFTNEGKIKEHQQTFLAELKAIPDVLRASSMSGNLVGSHSGGGGVNWEGKTERVEFSGLYVDYDFTETLDIKLVSGRSFSNRFGSDSSKVLFNETAIAAMGLKNPIGKTVTMWGKEKQIIGIIKDFNFESLYKKIGPFFLSYTPNPSTIIVKIKAGKEKNVVSQIEQLYKRYNPGLPFDYTFVDQDYQTLYASEQRVAVLSRCFAGLAIIISCLGLFGLTAFTAQRRQKEIGIRKVIGATTNHIIVMLSKDFLKLVLVAMLIAFPVAGWAVKKWLSNFAYRTDVGVSIYLLTGGSIIAITLLVVSYQAIKAALLNPVTSLRSE